MKQANITIRKKIECNKEFFSELRRSDFSHQVKGCMQRKEITLTDVAERLGVSPANLSRMLNGRQNVTIDNIYAIADALEERIILAFEESLKGTSWVKEISLTVTIEQEGWKEVYSSYTQSSSHQIFCSKKAANDEIPAIKNNSNWNIENHDFTMNLEDFEINKTRVCA